MQALAHYWATEYDWRKVEARLNALPQFITEIDGLDIHFIHVRSKHENALPLIVTHGWPGSITEQMKIIDPLTNPTANGGNASDAFHVVIPSMPGYGFSGRPSTTGWNSSHIARAWVVLMKRLGYEKFVAQGGDWGAIITEIMGAQAPPELLGIHTNMANVIPPDIDKLAFSGAPAPANLTDDEKIAYERLSFVYAKGIGYGFQMGLRPQTLYGIADSPIGLAAYFLDHDARSYELIARVFDGQSEGLTRDDVLDNVTLAWLTNTGVSGGRLYWENWGASFFAVKGVTVPTAVSVFPDELYPAPKSWAERAYPKLIHYNKLPKGGHFAAWEQPQFLSEEVRAGFRSLQHTFQDALPRLPWTAFVQRCGGIPFHGSTPFESARFEGFAIVPTNGELQPASLRDSIGTAMERLKWLRAIAPSPSAQQKYQETINWLNNIQNHWRGASPKGVRQHRGGSRRIPRHSPDELKSLDPSSAAHRSRPRT